MQALPERGFIKILPLRCFSREITQTIAESRGLSLLLPWSRTKGYTVLLNLHFRGNRLRLSTTHTIWTTVFTKILSTDPHAATMILKMEEFQRNNLEFNESMPSLSSADGVVDGVKFYQQEVGDCNIQNMFYKGWKAAR